MNERAKLILNVMLDHLPIRNGIGEATCSGCGYITSKLGHFVQEHQAVEIDKALS